MGSVACCIRPIAAFKLCSREVKGLPTCQFLCNWWVHILKAMTFHVGYMALPQISIWLKAVKLAIISASHDKAISMTTFPFSLIFCNANQLISLSFPVISIDTLSCKHQHTQQILSNCISLKENICLDSNCSMSIHPGRGRSRGSGWREVNTGSDTRVFIGSGLRHQSISYFRVGSRFTCRF